MPKILIFIILFVLDTPVHAMWQKMTDEQLVDNSVLIVNATLIAKSIIQVSPPMTIGVLLINRVYKGAANEKAVIIKLPYVTPVGKGIKTIRSSDIHYTIDQKGIWFLRIGKENLDLYYADNPQRFWPNKKEETLKQLIHLTK